MNSYAHVDGRQQNRSLDRTNASSDPSVVSCSKLAVGYAGEVILQDVSLTVGPSETVALVGRSGCGKTTLLKTLAGILPPIAGTGCVAGATLPDAPTAGALGYIPQDLGLVPHETVKRNVLLGTLPDRGILRSLLGRFPSDAVDDATAAIESVGLAQKTETRVSELSGGQRRRVAIARALVQEPQVLLADEILSELDDETAGSIVDCVETLQSDTEMAVIMVEHDRDVARHVADRIVRLGDGGFLEEIDTSGSSSDSGTRSSITRVDE